MFNVQVHKKKKKKNMYKLTNYDRLRKKSKTNAIVIVTRVTLSVGIILNDEYYNFSIKRFTEKFIAKKNQCVL